MAAEKCSRIAANDLSGPSSTDNTASSREASCFELGFEFGRPSITVSPRGRLHPLVLRMKCRRPPRSLLARPRLDWPLFSCCGLGAALSPCQSAAARLGFPRSGGAGDRTVGTHPAGFREWPASAFTVGGRALPVRTSRDEDGIPVTTILRTLIDLACRLPGPQLEAAINEATKLGLIRFLPGAGRSRRRGRATGRRHSPRGHRPPHLHLHRL